MKKHDCLLWQGRCLRCVDHGFVCQLPPQGSGAKGMGVISLRNGKVVLNVKRNEEANRYRMY